MRTAHRLNHGVSKLAPFAATLAILLLAGCKQIEVANQLDLREATAAVAKLQERGIPAALKAVGAGEEATYAVSVGGSDELASRQVLADYELLPDGVYAELVATVKKDLTDFSPEDKKEAALEHLREWELAQRIRGTYANVVAATVTVAVPKPDPKAILRNEVLIQRPTASVTVRYVNEPGSRPPSEREIKKLIAAGIENMSPADVEVLVNGVTPVDVGPRKQADTRVLFIPFAAVTLGLVAGLLVLVIKNRNLVDDLNHMREETEREKNASALGSGASGGVSDPQPGLPA